MRKAILLLIALPALIAAGIQASPSVGRSIQEPKQATKPADKPLEKDAQQPAEKQAESADNPSEPKQKPPFALRVTVDQIIGISLRAENAKLTDIAADLSKKLKVPSANLYVWFNGTGRSVPGIKKIGVAKYRLG